MKKLYTAVDRFCARHPRFGIPDLMRWIVIGNVAVYVLMLLTMRADANALSFLYLDGSKVLRGEIWRIVTFIFVPASSSPFWLAVSLYFYYWIGTSLERQWGTARFNLYYWSGVLLTAIVTIAASAISGTGYPVGGTEYVNLSMFLAFAFLFRNVFYSGALVNPVPGHPAAAVLLHPGEDQVAGLAGYCGVRHRHHPVPAGRQLAGRHFAGGGAAELPGVHLARY